MVTDERDEKRKKRGEEEKDESSQAARQLSMVTSLDSFLPLAAKSLSSGIPFSLA